VELSGENQLTDEWIEKDCVIRTMKRSCAPVVVDDEEKGRIGYTQVALKLYGYQSSRAWLWGKLQRRQLRAALDPRWVDGTRDIICRGYLIGEEEQALELSGTNWHQTQQSDLVDLPYLIVREMRAKTFPRPSQPSPLAKQTIAPARHTIVSPMQ